MKALLNSAVVVLDLVSSEGTIDVRHKDIIAQAHECCEELHAIVLCPEVPDSLGVELGRIGVSSVIPIICPEAALRHRLCFLRWNLRTEASISLERRFSSPRVSLTVSAPLPLP